MSGSSPCTFTTMSPASRPSLRAASAIRSVPLGWDCAVMQASIATAAHPIQDSASFFNPNVVKVVVDGSGYAHYFSSAPIPWARDLFGGVPLEALPRRIPKGLPALRHIGIYAYRVRFLQEYARLTPTPAEQFEALEQLRALGHGHRIAVALWDGPMEPGVDTAEDLERVRKRLSRPL